MIIKTIGAVLIIAGCLGVGLLLCRNHRREEESLKQLVHSLEWMRLELNYRMPALPVLCRDVSKVVSGTIGTLFYNLSFELEQQITPDVSTCMNAAIQTMPKLPSSVIIHLRNLGTSLGQFDLEGQILALEAEESLCKSDLEKLIQDREGKFRNYRVLGLCAGAAMVLLFI